MTDEIRTDQNQIIENCPCCLSIVQSQPEIDYDGSFSGVEVGAYPCWWSNMIPKVGNVINMKVNNTLKLDIGDSFLVEYEEMNMVTLRLLRIVSSFEDFIMIEVEVLSIKNNTEFLEPVTPALAEEIKSQGSYDYMPKGDYWQAEVDYINERFFSVYSCLGGGDIVYVDYIFTDDLGIDHRLGSNYRDTYMEAYYFGDEILGMHKDFPHKWELR